MSDKLTISPGSTVLSKGGVAERTTKVFQIKYLGLQTYCNALQIAKGTQTITLYNGHQFTLEPFESKQIFFNIVVITSLPGICIMYGNEHLQLFGLNYIINHIKTNDQILSITVCNITDQKLTFKENTMAFHCLILIAKHV